MQQFYKVLNADGTCFHGGSGAWDIPTNGEPGAWREVKGKLVACRNAIHLVSREQLVDWLGPAIFPIEPEGEATLSDNKYICRKARLTGPALPSWNERMARLLACDYAERVLPIFEKEYSGDPRVRNCIEVARRFAQGKATKEEITAARDAARDAARGAARGAAWAAARGAAWGAAWAAAWAAAGAAWDAAGAAWAAAGAAWDAARAAARDAAGAAGWNAERNWQTERLFDYLEGRAS